MGDGFDQQSARRDGDQNADPGPARISDGESCTPFAHVLVSPAQGRSCARASCVVSTANAKFPNLLKNGVADRSRRELAGGLSQLRGHRFQVLASKSSLPSPASLFLLSANLIRD